MKSNIIFFPGNKQPDNMKLFLESSRLGTVDVLLPNPKILSNWHKSEHEALDINSFFNIETFSDIEISESSKLKYTETMKELLSDSRTFFLMERIFRFERQNSIFNISGDLSIFVLNTFKYLQIKKPKIVVCFSTPHHLSWHFSFCAEKLGIKVIYTQISPIIYKRWIVEGIQNPKNILLKGEPSEKKLNEWIDKLQSSYDEAIPEYEKNRNNTFKLGDRNIISNLKDILFKSTNNSFRYNKIINLKSKLNTLKLYEDLSFKGSLPQNFIVFFMHYQPERTSLPEGREYAQQMNIILDLHLNLPKGYDLIIKEHPSMFRNMFNKRVRSNKFYKNIAGLRNVKIAPLSFESFDLIDHSKGVVTITGTVGIEALLRNKPILVYGDAQYLKFDFAFEQKVMQQKEQFFKNLGYEYTDKEISRSTINSLNEADNNSFPLEKSAISLKALQVFIDLETEHRHEG
jgi:hypothetical protein